MGRERYDHSAEFYFGDVLGHGAVETDTVIKSKPVAPRHARLPHGNGEGNFFIVVVDYYYGGVVLVEPAVGNIAVARVQRLNRAEAQTA